MIESLTKWTLWDFLFIFSSTVVSKVNFEVFEAPCQNWGTGRQLRTTPVLTDFYQEEEFWIQEMNKAVFLALTLHGTNNVL